MTKKTSRTRKPTTRKIVRKPRKVDFSDEAAVLKEVARELDLDPEDCEIQSGSAPNGYGSAYTISVGRHTEYIVMENEEEFEQAARNGVENDLKEQPELFSRDFIESHIDIERLRDVLHSDTFDSNYDRVNDEAERKPMEFLKENDIDIPSPSEKQLRDHAELESSDEKSADEIYAEVAALDPEEQWDTIGEEPEVPNSVIEEVAESQTQSQLRDPMSYLADIFGREESVAKAIEFAGIDIEKAADEAVSTDGAAHFMCNYDGNYDTTKSGFLFWRHN